MMNVNYRQQWCWHICKGEVRSEKEVAGSLDCFLNFGRLSVVLKCDACTIHRLIGERWTVQALGVDYPLAKS
jgi:hypothetical protein